MVTLAWRTRGRWACAWPVDEVESARQSKQRGYHVLGCKRNVLNPEITNFILFCERVSLTVTLNKLFVDLIPLYV
jgi:hypothetical protein